MLDLLQLETIWHRLINCATEQFKAMLKTAFSTVVRESEDCAVGIFDIRGDLLAQAPRGTPGQINSMATCIGNFLAVYPHDRLYPGDVMISNDPWQTSGHLNDVTVVTPVFRGDALIAFVGACAQVVDIGGRGFSSDAQSNYEEGLFIPITKLIRRGDVDSTIIEFIQHNVRSPELVVGDIFAQVTGNEVASKRILDMLDEFGLGDLTVVSHEILGRSERVLREAITQVPDGRYEGSVTTDGFDEPIVIKCAVKVDGDSITVDFAGTSPVVPWGINVPLCYTASYTTYALKCLLSPNVPNNGGTFRAIHVKAPPGCILNAAHPAPVAGRHIIGNFQPLAVYAALEQALPMDVIAGSSVLWITTAQGVDRGEPYTTTFFASGGMGARYAKDGLSATSFPGNIAMTPVEMLETVSPVVVRRKELRPDSAGPGKTRGGLGQDFVFTVRGEEDFTINTMSDQTVEPPQGFAGGSLGEVGAYLIDGRPFRPAKARVTLHAGQEILMRLPGGGGYGDPHARSTSAVLCDVEDGYVTLEAAARDYGVVLEGRDGELVVDEAGTRRQRGMS
jgi:N-methylhydantoinase B